MRLRPGFVLLLMSIALFAIDARAQQTPSYVVGDPHRWGGLAMPLDSSTGLLPALILQFENSDLTNLIHAKSAGKGTDGWTLDSIAIDPSLLTVTVENGGPVVRSSGDLSVDVMTAGSGNAVAHVRLDGSNGRTATLPPLAPGKYFVVGWTQERGSVRMLDVATSTSNAGTR